MGGQILWGIALLGLQLGLAPVGPCQAGPRPDAACTPGAADPRVTPATLAQTICRRGYTATVRPPLALTSRWKAAGLLAYGYPHSAWSAIEHDHLIPLEMGGDPGAVQGGTQWQPTAWAQNLWPEPWNRADGLDAHHKDRVERAGNHAICAGTLALADAQHAIARDWVAFGCQLRVLPCPAEAS